MTSSEETWKNIDSITIRKNGGFRPVAFVNGEATEFIDHATRLIYRWKNLVIKIDGINHSFRDCQSIREGQLWNRIKRAGLEELAKQCLVPTIHYGVIGPYGFNVQPWLQLDERLDRSNIEHPIAVEFHEKLVELGLALNIDILDLNGNVWWSNGSLILPDYALYNEWPDITREEVWRFIRNDWAI